MAVRQSRPRAAAPVVLDDATTDEFWGEELPPVARSLLGSAVMCFARKGFNATTTRDIGVGAGLSQAALYVHFDSKEKALFEVMRIGHQRALEALGSAAERKGTGRDPATAIAELTRRLVVWHARHHTVARVCQFELTALDPEHYQEILAVRRGITDVFRFAVARGAAAGVFHVDNVNRMVRTIVSLGVDLVRWYRLDGADSPEELGDFYAGLALRMLDAEK